MKQQSTPQRASASLPVVATRAPQSVVMGQGVITPVVREHLGKAAKLGRAAAKPQTVVMGQGVITPSVREHLGKIAKSRQVPAER